VVDRTERDHRLTFTDAPGETVDNWGEGALPPTERLSHRLSRAWQLFLTWFLAKPEDPWSNLAFDFKTFEGLPVSRHVARLTNCNAVTLNIFAVIRRTHNYDTRLLLMLKANQYMSYSVLYAGPSEEVNLDEPTLKVLANKLKSSSERISVLWFTQDSSAIVDTLALAGDQEEIRADLAVAVIKLLGETRPDVLVHFGHQILQENRTQEIPPRAREALAGIFDEYARRLRSSNVEGHRGADEDQSNSERERS
jgi:hypothetical protein